MDEKNNTTERPAPKAPESAPVRRVGTLTLGVCLIACGVLFLCYFFVPHFNWDLALKIAPAAGLILLVFQRVESLAYGLVGHRRDPQALHRALSLRLLHNPSLD